MSRMQSAREATPSLPPYCTAIGLVIYENKVVLHLKTAVAYLTSPITEISRWWRFCTPRAKNRMPPKCDPNIWSEMWPDLKSKLQRKQFTCSNVFHRISNIEICDKNKIWYKIHALHSNVTNKQRMWANVTCMYAIFDTFLCNVRCDFWCLIYNISLWCCNTGVMCNWGLICEEWPRGWSRSGSPRYQAPDLGSSSSRSNSLSLDIAQDCFSLLFRHASVSSTYPCMSVSL